jgi:hypothetical protein
MLTSMFIGRIVFRGLMQPNRVTSVLAQHHLFRRFCEIKYTAELRPMLQQVTRLCQREVRQLGHQPLAA